MKSALSLLIGIIILLSVIFVGKSYLGKNNSPVVTPQQWKTYTNNLYHYSIQYPGDWTFREFSDPASGAAFQPLTKPKDYQNEYISIDLGRKITSDGKNLPFEEYVKTAAHNEIQGFGELLSIDKVTTTSNIVGYKTTWKVSPPPGAGGEASASEPITYFSAPNNDIGIIKVSLNNDTALSTYQQMLSTFKE